MIFNQVAETDTIFRVYVRRLEVSRCEPILGEFNVWEVFTEVGLITPEQIVISVLCHEVPGMPVLNSNLVGQKLIRMRIFRLHQIHSTAQQLPGAERCPTSVFLMFLGQVLSEVWKKDVRIERDEE